MKSEHRGVNVLDITRRGVVSAQVDSVTATNLLPDLTQEREQSEREFIVARYRSSYLATMRFVRSRYDSGNHLRGRDDCNVCIGRERIAYTAILFRLQLST